MGKNESLHGLPASPVLRFTLFLFLVVFSLQARLSLPIPRENEKNLIDLPEHVKKELEFVFVENVSEVITDLFRTVERKRIPA